MQFQTIDINKHREYVIAFRRDSFFVSFGTDQDFGGEDAYINWLQTKINDFPEGFVMVWDNDMPIGQLELSIRTYKEKEVGYVNLYYLIPEKRGAGLGQKLHDYALTFFKRHGLKEYHLRVSPTNSQALAFYKKHGLDFLETEFDGKVVRMRGKL